jgi:antirestriction protein ArdC
MATETKKTDVYQIVTDRILAELDKGIVPWRKPWIALQVKWTGRTTHTETRTVPQAYSRSTGKPYSLLNQMLLGKPGEWASFKQIAEAGGRVKKGEKSSVCVFWKFIEKDAIDPKTGKPAVDPKTGKPMKDSIPMLRYYNVFHVETQCEGIEPKKRKVDPQTHTVTIVDDPGTCTTKTDADWADVEEADAIVRAYLAGSGVKLTEEPGSDRAFYRPSTDSVTIPCRAQFKDRAEFYSTEFHELVHSTGHVSRLDRFSGPGNHSFGGEEYSKEELVAEIGAACLNSICGIESTGSFKNSAAYIAGWSSKLREDRKMIVGASSRAEKAVELILNGGVMA